MLGGRERDRLRGRAPATSALIGNMLTGAGEIDAAMLVVAADDGPRAQTREHLAILNALGMIDALAGVTKADVAPSGRAAGSQEWRRCSPDRPRRRPGARGVRSERCRAGRPQGGADRRPGPLPRWCRRGATRTARLAIDRASRCRVAATS